MLVLGASLAFVGCESEESQTDKASATAESTEEASAEEKGSAGAANAGNSDEKAKDEGKEDAPGGPVVAEGPLSVQLPAGFPEPERKTQPIETVVGTVEGTMFQSMGPDGMAMVMYNTYPPEVFEQQTVKTMLEGARDGAVNNVGAELVSEKPIREGEYPMKTFIAKKSMGGQSFYFRMEMHVVRPHFVQLQFASQNRDRLDDEDVEAYYESLELDTEGKNEDGQPDGAGDEAAE